MDSVQPVTRSTLLESPGPLLLDLAALALVALGNALLAARVNVAPLVLVLIASGSVLRAAQFRLQLLVLPLHLPWLVFIVSAWIGVTVSYDPALSFLKFELILGGVALYYVVATIKTEAAKKLVAWGLVLVGAGVAFYFLTQTDFTREPIKIGLLNQIGVLIHRLAPQFGLHTPHANLMAGIMLLCLPYALGLAYDALRKQQWASMLGGGACALLLAFSLVMTTSRGAILALVLLGLVSGYLWGAAMIAKRARVSTGLGIALALNALLVLVIMGLVVGGNRLGATLSSAAGTVSGVPRLVLYQQVSQLAQDYTFTGAGLDTFSPNFSTYELEINVPFLPHGHNLYLQVWYEQGILGILAFIWLVVAYYVWALRRRARINWLAAASIAATTLMLMHGLVDVLFYFSRVIALMFIPLGLTVCALDPFTPLNENSPANTRRSWFAVAAAVAVLLVLIGIFVVVRREQVTAQWIANLGALEQARLELPQIKFPNPTPGEVRRNTDLAESEALYLEALEHDSANRIAHGRLGLIALDRFEFDRAVAHLEAAYRIDRNHRAVVKALGMAYVWTGHLDQAEPLLRQIDESEIELGYTLQEWRERGRTDLAAHAREMMQRLKP